MISIKQIKIPVLLSLLVLFLTTEVLAQQTKQVEGIIQDEEGEPVYGATVFLSSNEDSTYTSSNQNGEFAFKNVKGDSISLKITHIVFQEFEQLFSFENESRLELPPIQLQQDINMLDEVVVSADMPVLVKEDTVQYDANAYSPREGSLLVELLEKIPGLEINEDGELIAHGEQVSRIQVNGKDFFGGDVRTALDNLPADIIKNVQVVDDYGERARLTGFKEGDPEKVVNVNTNTDRIFSGRTSAAAGDQERYLGAFSGNMINGDREIAAIGSINNTNTNPLRQRRYRRGSNGITRNISAAGNYQNEFGETLEATGSYRYSNRETTNSGSNISRSIFDDFTNHNRNDFTNISTNATHSFNYEFEYRPDDSNFLEISPEIDFTKSRTSNSRNFYIEQNNSSQTRISEGENSTESEEFSNDFGFDLLYIHSFQKEGRSFSMDVDAGYNNQKRDRETETNTTISMGASETLQQNNQLIRNDNDDRSADVRLSYTEPLFENSQMELSYGLDLSERNDEQSTWDLIEGQQAQNRIDSLSTRYRYNVTTNRAGLSFRTEKEKLSYSVGLNLQPEVQKGIEETRGISVSNRTMNVIPEARLSYGESRRNRFSVRYGGRTNQPNFTQLQPVADLSNPQYPVIGNPNLEPEFTNSLHVSYRNFDFESQNMTIFRINLQQTNNKIVSNVINDFAGDNPVIEERRFLNADGFYSASGNYMFNKPLMERKLSIGFNGGINYNNNVTYLNDEKRSGADWSWSQGIRLRTDIKDVVNASLRADYRMNQTDYAVSRRGNGNDLRSFRLGIRGENYFFDNWVLGYNFNKTFNSRIEDELNSDPLILNLTLEREFLENRASLKLQGFDLFNQNTGISRSVNGNTITNSRNNLLSRYFLISFSLRLQEFTL